jgi:ABC-type nitrate/sulfonate/bicarbonate transport system substrate-binding protein
MSKRIRRSLIGSLVLLSALGPASQLVAASLEKVNASYGAISGSMAQTWVAKEARLYEKYDLDLNLVYISGGPRSIMSLIGSSVQFVNHSGMPDEMSRQYGK